MSRSRCGTFPTCRTLRARSKPRLSSCRPTSEPDWRSASSRASIRGQIPMLRSFGFGRLNGGSRSWSQARSSLSPPNVFSRRHDPRFGDICRISPRGRGRVHRGGTLLRSPSREPGPRLHLSSPQSSAHTKGWPPSQRAAARSGLGSAASLCPAFHTVWCTALRRIASSSSPLLTYAAGQATGAPEPERRAAQQALQLTGYRSFGSTLGIFRHGTSGTSLHPQRRAGS